MNRFAAMIAVLGVALHLGLADKPKTPVDLDALIAKMTLEEKLGQLTQQWGGESQDMNPGARDRALSDLLGLAKSGQVGSFLGATGAEYTNKLQKAAVEESKHGIPLLFGNDIIHGYRTGFPIPLAEAATWNSDLIEQACRVAAIEGRAAGTPWTFAPMIDICRDPRWGRIAETAGEDHFLGSIVAAARVRGFQGDDLRANDSMIACGKHFVAYGAAEAGRDYNTVDLSLQTLHEVHLAPFRAAIDANVGTIMSAFNEINGVPATANHYALRDVLREKLGFSGMIVSDWTSVTEMVNHGYAADAAMAATQAIREGVDMDMSSFSYRTHLAEKIKAGELDEKYVNESLRRVLQTKQKLGLFENPYSDPELEKKVLLADEHRALAREVARRSFVLLRNEDNLLPLDKNTKRIAVIGPLAEARKDMLGTWSLHAKNEEVVTLIDGLRNALGDETELKVTKGSDVRTAIDGGIDEAVRIANDSDVVILAVGESENMSGEAYSRSRIEMPEPQLEMIKAVHATGKPIVLVLFNGRPMALPWIAENIPAVLVAWHPGTEAGNAVADILFGDASPSGKLPATFPRSTGQVPLYYNHKNTGRPPKEKERYTSKYIDVPWTPLYPFGYGLSYTTFEFVDLNVTPTTIAANESVNVTVTVKNTGERTGTETVQVYYRDPVASMTRPVRQLCGFKQVTIEPGQSKQVTLEIPVSRFAFFDWDLLQVVEPGTIEFYVGNDASATMKQDITIR